MPWDTIKSILGKMIGDFTRLQTFVGQHLPEPRTKTPKAQNSAAATDRPFAEPSVQFLFSSFFVGVILPHIHFVAVLDFFLCG